MIRFPTNGIIGRYPTGTIIQGYGENPALYKQFGEAGHDGIDIIPEIGYGEPVYAPHSGLIVKVYYDANPALGNQVHILSDVMADGKQLLSRLGHFAPGAIVNQGDRCYIGQHIANMGNTGNVVSGGISYWHNANPDNKGTHTHWSTYWLKESVTPSNTSYFGKNYIIYNYKNGFFGAVDPLIVLKDDMNTFVETMNYQGTVGIFVPVSDPSQIPLLSNLFNVPLVVAPDGSIATSKTVKDI